MPIAIGRDALREIDRLRAARLEDRAKISELAVKLADARAEIGRLTAPHASPSRDRHSWITGWG